MPEDGTRLVLDSIVASGSDLQDGQAWVVKREFLDVET